MDSRIYILTHKRLTDQLSSIEESELNKLSLIPENQALSEEIAYLWNVSNNYFPKKDWKKDAAKQAFYDKIKTTTPKAIPTTVTSSTANTGLNWGKVLGAILGILLLGWLVFSLFNKKEVIKAKDKIEYAEILDETKVWLEPGSSLTVLEESSTHRKVALVGEAIFDVLHNPNRPFTLDLGDNIYAEVLGTSFKATSTHGGTNGRISVREGKVRLYSTDNAEYNIVIMADQEGEIDRNYGPQRNKTVLMNALMSGGDQITFDATPLNEVLDKLGLHYGVKFNYKEKEIRSCRFSTVVPDDASLSDIISSITDIHQNLEMKPVGRSTYQVGGTCQ